MTGANLYSDLADVCVKFYDLVIDSKKVAEFVDSKIKKYSPKKILFVGGFFNVAKELIKKGYDITVADYTDEMVEEGKRRLPNTKVVKGDLKDLHFENEFDAVLVIGRVFTHMYTDDETDQALQSIRRSLKPNGITFFDNYEDNKIQVTDYFNGIIRAKDGNIEIIRNSSTELISKSPLIVNWKATYILKEGGNVKEYNDEMEHRGYSRQEISDFLEKNGFTQIENGDNFDDTSFYVLARKN